MPAKRLNVLAILDNLPRGVDWYRLRVPLRHLDAHNCAVALCPARELTQHLYDWADVIAYATMFPTTPTALAALRAFATKRRKVLVKDIDDDHWHPDPTNPFHRSTDAALAGVPFGWSAIPDVLPRIEASIIGADLVTTTNATLAAVLTQRFGVSPAILPNCLDPADWAFDKATTRTIPPPVVGVHGGESHDADWRVLAEVFPLVAERYPDVTFACIGHLPDYLARLGLGERLRYLPMVPVDRFPPLLANLDIGLCPLLDTTFNRSKSPLKLYEVCAAEAVAITSPTVYGDVARHWRLRAGAMQNDPEWWAAEVFYLLDQEQERKRDAAVNRANVLKRASIERAAHLWADAYRSAWERVQ